MAHVIDATHDPALQSWVESANRPDAEFPIQNLPYATFVRKGHEQSRLGMAIGEMLGFKSTPFPIVINEALEIARRYSAPESINFLNGMLDSIARSLLPK